MSHIEQRYNIKFCMKLGKSPTETYQLLEQVYGDNSLSRRRVFEWHRRFREGQESVEDEHRSGRPLSASNAESRARVSQLLDENPRILLSKIAATLEISYGTAHKIVTEDLGLNRVCCRWIPHALTDAQRDRRVEASRENLHRHFLEGQDFLKRIVTGDESWLYFYDPETKQQSSVWKKPGDPTPVKTKRGKSAGKVMIVVFFDSEGIVYRHVFKQGETVTGRVYTDVLANLRDAVNRKRPVLRERGWRLLHDNAPSHSSELCQSFLSRNNIEQLTHPPYSPDLAPSDFWLFPEMKRPLRGRYFHDENELVQSADAVLRDLSKDGLLFVFEKWCSRMTKCIELNGQYIEKQ